MFFNKLEHDMTNAFIIPSFNICFCNIWLTIATFVVYTHVI